MPSPSTPRATPRLLLALCFHLLQSVHCTSSSPIAPNDANAFQTAYNDNTITRIVLSAGTWSEVLWLDEYTSEPRPCMFAVYQRYNLCSQRWFNHKTTGTSSSSRIVLE